jgi:hypothetical protein
MMTETQNYLEKIQGIADSALAEAALKSAPPSRKASLISPVNIPPRRVSLTTAFAATTITTPPNTGRPLMSSAEQRDTNTTVKDTQEQLEPQLEEQQAKATELRRAQSAPEEGQSQLPRRPSMPKGESSNDSAQSTSSDMSDTKLSRFYHAMGSSESGAAERREAEERARKEAEERARQQSEGK